MSASDTATRKPMTSSERRPMRSMMIIPTTVIATLTTPMPTVASIAPAWVSKPVRPNTVGAK